MPTNKIKNTKNIVALSIKNGILFSEYYDCKITLNIAKKLVRDRQEFTKNISYPVLITSSGRINLTREARVFLSSKEGTENLSLIALVHENSIINIMLINFMLKIHPPLIPIKSFKNKKKALSWIKNQKLKP